MMWHSEKADKMTEKIISINKRDGGKFIEIVHRGDDSMFQPKALFHAGLKIVGVLTIIWSFMQVVPVVFQFFTVYNQPDMMSGNDLRHYRFSLIFQVVYPILLLVLGLYFVKSGQAIVQWAFRDADEEKEDKVGALFILFMKLAGLALMIYAIPKALQILSNIMFISSTNAVDTTEQMEFIIRNFVTVGINLLLGLYLLKSGKIFYKLGFANKEDADNGEN